MQNAVCVIKQFTAQPHWVLAVPWTHLSGYPFRPWLCCSLFLEFPPTQQVSHPSALSSCGTLCGRWTFPCGGCTSPRTLDLPSPVKNSHLCHQFHSLWALPWLHRSPNPASHSPFSSMKIITWLLTSGPLHLLFPLLGNPSRFSYNWFFLMSYPVALTGTWDYAYRLFPPLKSSLLGKDLGLYLPSI